MISLPVLSIRKKHQFLTFILTSFILAACGQATTSKPSITTQTDHNIITKNANKTELKTSALRQEDEQEFIKHLKEYRPIIQEKVQTEQPALSQIVKETKRASIKKHIKRPKRPFTPTPIFVDKNPDQFLKTTINEITDKLGTPRFVRRDGIIEVWQYQKRWQNGICSLDLFLYPNSKKLTVKFVDLRSNTLSYNDKNICFTELMKDEIRKKRANLW